MRKSWLWVPVLALIFQGCERADSQNDPRESGFCVTETNETRFPFYGNFPDWLLPYQWHLKNNGQMAGSLLRAVKEGEDINVTAVWGSGDLNKTGRGVVIGIVDTGVELRHPELISKVATALSWNYYRSYNSQSAICGGYVFADDPTPIGTTADHAHGTACAGIAAAPMDGAGVVGVAPGATIAGLNVGVGMHGACESDMDYQDALSVYPANSDRGLGGESAIDIYSNSWGCPPEALDCVSTEEHEAKIEGITAGRGGKGAIYLFAAGNERTSGVNANYLAEQNGFETISVAALDSDGGYAYYSNPGANILISAYGGTGSIEPGIITTDLSGCNAGLSTIEVMQHQLNWNGQYTHRMNGTSAATPMVAGVVALMLEANPGLTWRDVRYILATTARRNDPDNNVSWQTNGAGHWVSHDYGFGAVDAYSAVKKAQTFESVGGSENLKYQCHVYADDDSGWDSLLSMLNVSEVNLTRPEYVAVKIDLNVSSGRDRDLALRLISPAQTVSVLSEPNTVLPNGFYRGGRRFGSVHYLDENITGSWKLELSAKGGTEGNAILQNWELCFYGR